MTDPITRLAIESDVPWMLEGLRDISQNYPSQISLFGDYEEAKERLTWFVENHFMLVAEIPVHEGVKRVGLVGGFIAPHFMNSEFIQLTQIFFWVDRDHRFSTAAKTLLDEFIKYGDKAADRTLLNTHVNTRIHEKHFINRGFKECERVYSKESV